MVCVKVGKTCNKWKVLGLAGARVNQVFNLFNLHGKKYVHIEKQNRLFVKLDFFVWLHPLFSIKCRIFNV